MRRCIIFFATTAFIGFGSEPILAKTVSINIMSGPFRFEPATIDANPGDTIAWTNTTSTEHTISPDQDGVFPEKDPIEPKETYSITVPANLGPIPYHCNFHPMNATINVVKP